MTTYKRIKGDYNLTTLTNGAEVTVTTANVLINANANVSGNITGTYFIGDGGFLTNVVATSTYGNSNVAAYLPGYTGNIAADSISATGNVVGGNIIFASGTVSGTGNIYANKIFANIQGNIDAAGNLNEVQFNSAGDQLGASANFTYDSANIVLTVNGGNILGGNVSVSGNVAGDVGLFNDVNVNNAATNKILYTDSNRNIYDTGFSYDSANTEISGTGNITAAYFVGNGSLLTGVVSSYSDSNVVTLLSAFGSNTISTTGNVTAGYVLGNGSQLSGLPETYTNANVITLLSAFGNNVIDTTGNITGGALLTAGYVSATGNVTGDYIYGNGAFLTGVTGLGGNANSIVNGITTVAIPTSSGNVEITVGFSTNVVVITNDGLIANGTIDANSVSATTGISAAGNITGGHILTAGLVSATGNIIGNYILGDGSQLSNIQGILTYGNANVAAYLPTYTGNLGAGNVAISGQANITGNVNVNYQSRINGTVDGQLNGLINGVNTAYGTWDFGFIAANTYANPIQWIFAQTAAGNVDMGTVTAPASLNIDIGTIF